MQPNNWNLETLGFRFFTFPHTCFSNQRGKEEFGTGDCRWRVFRWRQGSAGNGLGWLWKQGSGRSGAGEELQCRTGTGITVGEELLRRRPRWEMAEVGQCWSPAQLNRTRDRTGETETGEGEVWLAHVVVWKKRSRRVWGDLGINWIKSGTPPLFNSI